MLHPRAAIVTGKWWESMERLILTQQNLKFRKQLDSLCFSMSNYCDHDIDCRWNHTRSQRLITNIWALEHGQHGMFIDHAQIWDFLRLWSGQYLVHDSRQDWYVEEIHKLSLQRKPFVGGWVDPDVLGCASHFLMKCLAASCNYNYATVYIYIYTYIYI